MGTEKLDTGLDQVKIEQTRDKIDPIRFRDETINKVRKENYKFDKKRYLYIPFKVDKDTHFKGLKLKIAKGSPGDKDTQKTFFIQFWFNGRANKHKIARYSQRFGTKECNEYLVDLFNTHTDPATKLWIKDPNETRKNGELSQVEDPPFDRSFFKDLAHCQWNTEEIMGGDFHFFLSLSFLY